MPKVSKFICDGANGARCESEVTENGFTALYNLRSNPRAITFLRGILEDTDNYSPNLYFCSEGCLLKYLTQAIRELK